MSATKATSVRIRGCKSGDVLIGIKDKIKGVLIVVDEAQEGESDQKKLRGLFKIIHISNTMHETERKAYKHFLGRKTTAEELKIYARTLVTTNDPQPTYLAHLDQFEKLNHVSPSLAAN